MCLDIFPVVLHPKLECVEVKSRTYFSHVHDFDGGQLSGFDMSTLNTNTEEDDTIIIKRHESMCVCSAVGIR